ncbi:hypothetical protein BC628DRAFT_348835 [Trametes gibbosa]|uniref:CCHC-type domain-containing protein n=1 Tax=Trametes gibbosa TaxID=160864 RepID=A0A6G6FQ46_9APHY|nr:hypothetical protein BC628DRAFT_348835 [Trametes gibbosa]QIE48442.1 hypothetical protein [Trametes gibbosa]
MAYQFSRKGCFKCGNLGHIAENCSSEQRLCYNCRQPGRFGHFARSCPSGAGGGFASRAPPPGRGLNTSTLPPVKCYRCGGPNHMARDCLAPPGTAAETGVHVGNPNKNKTCYKCQQEGHVRDMFTACFMYFSHMPTNRSLVTAPRTMSSTPPRSSAAGARLDTASQCTLNVRSLARQQIV